MANSDKHKRPRRTLLIIVGVLVLVVLAVAAGVLLRWWQSSQELNQQATLPALPAAIEDIQNIRDNGDAAAVNDAIDKVLTDPNADNEIKYLAYIQQGHVAMENQQWQEAIDAYTKSWEIKQDKENAGLLGDAYAALGDKAKAKEFYEKAIELVPQDYPPREALIREYEDRIRWLDEGAEL